MHFALWITSEIKSVTTGYELAFPKRLYCNVGNIKTSVLKAIFYTRNYSRPFVWSLSGTNSRINEFSTYMNYSFSI